MGRGGGLNVLGALCYQGALFAILSLLARLGKEDVGRYTTCYALLSLLVLLSLFGFRAGMTRFVATNLADGDAARLRGTIRLGLGLTTIASVVVAAGLAASAGWVAEVMRDPGLEAGVLIVALTLPAMAFVEVALSATQGWRTQRPFTLVGRIGEPAARLALTAVAVLLGMGYLGALWSMALSAWGAAVVAGFVLRRRLRRELDGIPRQAAVYQLREIFSFSTVSWISALAATGLIWVDTLLLGVLEGQDEVGTYSVATRLVMLAVFVMAPINATFTPHMAHLYHVGDLDEASRAYGSATRWILVLSAPAFVMLVCLPEQLLSYFGDSFVQAAGVTVVLAVGQLVGAATGPCGTVLNMSGRVRLNMIDNVAALVLNVGLNLLLIPRYGVLGASLAWSISLVAVNLAKLLQARYVVGIRATGASWGKVALASLPAVVVAVVVQSWTDGWVPALTVGGTGVVLVFFSTFGLLGVPDDDRAVLSSLLRRRSRSHERLT